MIIYQGYSSTDIIYLILTSLTCKVTYLENIFAIGFIIMNAISLLHEINIYYETKQKVAANGIDISSVGFPTDQFR